MAVDPAMAVSAQHAHQRAKPGNIVIGWKLDREQRKELLLQFPPKFSEVIADHVTLSARVARSSELPQETLGEIVGRTDDGKGVEALVVSIDGTTDRPDGSTYHITWSVEQGRRAKESNDVIRQFGWTEIELPVPVMLQPARF
jgi:hypothetical protein